MNIFLDQGIPYSTTKNLKKKGHKVLHTVDLKMQQASDREIITYARHHSFICITLDSDFHTIIAIDGEETPSIIRIRIEGLNGQLMSDLIVRVINQAKSQLETGSLITVTEKSIRIKSLPIRLNKHKKD